MNLADVERAISDRKLKWLAEETLISAIAATPGQFGLRATSLAAPDLQVATMMPEAFRGPRPAKIDWREQGRVTPARDQGLCGSCVAFATCAAMEGALAILEDRPAELDLAEADLFYCGLSVVE